VSIGFRGHRSGRVDFTSGRYSTAPTWPMDRTAQALSGPARLDAVNLPLEPWDMRRSSRGRSRAGVPGAPAVRDEPRSRRRRSRCIAGVIVDKRSAVASRAFFEHSLVEEGLGEAVRATGRGA
jgi:hypothetical protein